MVVRDKKLGKPSDHLSNIDQTSPMCEVHYGVVSCERVFEMTAELRSLIEEQDTLLSTGAIFTDMSAQELAAYAQRHARIRQLSRS